jgi:pyridoxine/pyridoxamine 5'-phosphate oxidase
MRAAGGSATWRARWRKNALNEGTRETKVFLSQPAYSRATAIAEQQSERLPVTLGHLIEFAVATIDGVKAPVMETPSLVPPSPIDLVDLTRAILASRFPDETGSARFRQLAFVHLVAAETMRGNRPTATTLAIVAGSHKSQMDLLSKVLVARGVIVKTHAPGLKGAPTAKILTIAMDAVQSLQKAHVAATGAAIVL